jgi:hypothetical protein
VGFLVHIQEVTFVWLSLASCPDAQERTIGREYLHRCSLARAGLLAKEQGVTSMKTFFVCLCLLVLAYALLNMSPELKSETTATARNTLHALAYSGHQSSTSVEGKPTIEASFIDRVLAAYHSKAAGTGQALYQDGVQYGIDPTYALAFFMHESMFGTTGVARATLSLGNIRCSDGYTCIEGYRAYGSWEQGYLDWFKLIKNGYISGQVSSKCPCVTIEQIVPVYAPSSDGNDVGGYIAAVENAVHAWRSGRIAV